MFLASACGGTPKAGDTCAAQSDCPAETTCVAWSIAANASAMCSVKCSPAQPCSSGSPCYPINPSQLAAGGLCDPRIAGGGGAGNCADSGASCKQDGDVVSYTAACQNNPNSQAPCYCAAAATDNCFLKHGCYKEAGAPTSVTQAQLESLKQQSLGQASQLGTTCTLH